MMKTRDVSADLGDDVREVRISDLRVCADGESLPSGPANSAWQSGRGNAVAPEHLHTEIQYEAQELG